MIGLLGGQGSSLQLRIGGSYQNLASCLYLFINCDYSIFKYISIQVSAERELSEVQAALLSPKVNMELNGNETYEKHENEGQFSVEETNSKGRKVYICVYFT